MNNKNRKTLKDLRSELKVRKGHLITYANSHDEKLIVQLEIANVERILASIHSKPVEGE